MREPELFISADQLMGRAVANISSDQWGKTVPTTPDWTVRELVAHIVDDNRWAADILAGRRIDDVASQFADGPLDELSPLASWTEAAESAEAGAAGVADLERTVHLSFGDTSARDYLRQMTIDRVIHTYDLAVAIGGEPEFPDDLVMSVWEWFEPQAESWRRSGILGPAIPPPANADLKTKLLMLSGRRLQ